MTVFILDLDNTLFDTRSIPFEVIDDLHSRLRAVNNELGTLPPRTMDMAIEEMWHTPFSVVRSRYRLPSAFDSVWDLWQSTVTFDRPLSPYPDVVASLESLRVQGHYLCLLTSGGRELQAAKINALGIAPLFDEIHIDGDNQDGEGKAGIILNLMHSRGWIRDQLEIVGDSATSEIEAGAFLGIFTVQILRPRIASTDVANHHIHSLMELCDRKLPE